MRRIVQLQQRSFGALKKPDNLDLPYLFENQYHIIKTREKTNSNMLQQMKQFLTNDSQNLQLGFKYAYLTLLKAISQKDYDLVGGCCEQSMYKAFAQGMDQLKVKGFNTEIMNEHNHKMELELVDFHNYYGASIDRNENKKKSIKEFNNFLMDVPNITMYTSGSALSSLQSMIGMAQKGKGNNPLKISGLTIEMIVRFKTNFKLNILNENNDKLISNDKARDDELHFVKFEGAYPEFEFSPDSMKKSLTTFNFRDWTIVDFDNKLLGNPHIQ
eukprot:403337441